MLWIMKKYMKKRRINKITGVQLKNIVSEKLFREKFIPESENVELV